MRFPHGFTLHVKRPSTTDRFGVTIPGTEHDIADCAGAPAGSTETMNGQITVLTQHTVYGPYDADVHSQDVAVIPAGQPIPAGEYRVDGQPQRWKHPRTGWEAGCVIRLENLEGGSNGS